MKQETAKVTTTHSVSASQEDYLEAISHLIEEKQAARVRDISRRLRVNYSSVTGALRALADKNLVNYAPYELVTLTPAGAKVAESVIRKHEALRDFFIKVMSVDPKMADEVACKMEHDMPAEIIERFVKFVEFVDECPLGGASWTEGVGYRCPKPGGRQTCDHCADSSGNSTGRKGATGKSKSSKGRQSKTKH